MIQISEEICSPAICKYECANACIRVHGKDPPIHFTKESLTPLIDKKTCNLCLACVRACPLNAISTGSNKNALLSSLEVIPPNVVEITESDKPYEMSETYTPMDEADTIFARVQYDPEFMYYQQTEFSGAENMIAKGLPGYSRFEHELSVAAWKLYDSRHSITRPGIGLDSTADEQGSRTISDPETLTELVKKAARFFGADLVGVATLNRAWLYTNDRSGSPYSIPNSFQRAVVMAIEMDYEAIATSPTFTSAAATGFGYSMMAFIETELVSFIRRLGYDATTCGNDKALSVPLAIDAGLGQYGRHGLLITKPFGPRVRIAKILTDMPLIPDRPDLDFCKSVTRFCETCEKCARYCPSQSIPYGRERTWGGNSISNNPGTRKWYIDVESCYGFWIQNGSECSNCIRSCPYNKTDGKLHRLVRWIIQHIPQLNRFIQKMDDLVGYGKQKNSGRFWRRLG